MGKIFRRMPQGRALSGMYTMYRVVHSTQCSYDVCTYIKSNPPHELAIELSSRSLTSLFHPSLATGCDIWHVAYIYEGDCTNKCTDRIGERSQQVYSTKCISFEFQSLVSSRQ